MRETYILFAVLFILLGLNDRLLKVFEIFLGLFEPLLVLVCLLSIHYSRRCHVVLFFFLLKHDLIDLRIPGRY